MCLKYLNVIWYMIFQRNRKCIIQQELHTQDKINIDISYINLSDILYKNPTKVMS